MKIRLALAATACLLAAACSTTTPPPPPPAATNITRQMSTWDMSTEYTVEYVADGFMLTMNYRYPDFVLRRSTAETRCRSVATSIADSLAERRQRPIAVPAAQQIQTVTQRKWTGAMATCAAVAHVTWRQ
ncbi:hypothetical protein [Cupriavidus pampae]|uniref:Lipoprotein n=1 Tax=Cupriavidus pampae TaxID=659251 RepID=A0ABN7XVE4_9BURK|nr:hypothetical protein [Cupriavidus pampae]CAG9163612.1 hypothetical protein LMG32289_00102 [Cupriavidus pampae]